ncbi:LOW QUALITY PROTEIN: hypothetical protein MSG28_008367 [Choristoneura fumiferana]|uniref:Uncharacterized protein n=1 Tax=Choristoneura fumiferana TaxID=7141 RepID=A0ACC0J445_CHOFU|nr:LOW QUALITY PROTEIN: hypothetical protein MSG28_008367 [Choristoneura fumiferana]
MRRGARVLALLAALAAGAGVAAPADNRTRTRAERASWQVSPSPPGAEDAPAGVPLDALEAPDALDAALGADSAPAWRELWYASLEARRRQPVLNASREDVLAQLGATAFLHCPVRHLGERGVSVAAPPPPPPVDPRAERRAFCVADLLGASPRLAHHQLRPVHVHQRRALPGSGGVLHSEGSDDWTLQIKFVQKRDNGTYECQVPTAAGALSRLVALHVLVPEAFILGGEEHHVDAGSTISLVCIIEKPGAAAVRVLVPQRAHDQLRRGARRGREHGARRAHAVRAHHPRRRAATLRELLLSRAQHGARRHLLSVLPSAPPLPTPTLSSLLTDPRLLFQATRWRRRCQDRGARRYGPPLARAWRCCSRPRCAAGRRGPRGPTPPTPPDAARRRPTPPDAARRRPTPPDAAQRRPTPTPLLFNISSNRPPLLSRRPSDGDVPSWFPSEQDLSRPAAFPSLSLMQQPLSYTGSKRRRRRAASGGVGRRRAASGGVGPRGRRLRRRSAAASSSATPRASGGPQRGLLDLDSVAAILSPVTTDAVSRPGEGGGGERRGGGRTLTALGDVDVDGGGLRVGRATGVVPGVSRRGVADGERGLRARAGRRADGHAARRVVIDHALVVVPEHVLRRHRALYAHTHTLASPGTTFLTFQRLPNVRVKF